MKYDFSGRLTKEFPSQIGVDVTEKCNYACIHCPHATFKESDYYTSALLDVALHNKMVDEVREHGKGYTQQIRYTANGEPLLHPKIYEMLTYAGNYSDNFVSLTTNGSPLTEKNVKKLIDANIDMIDISLDAYHSDTYDIVRVGGKLSKVKENVLNLIDYRNEIKSKLKIVVSFVKQKENENEVEDFDKFWKEKGVDFVIIRNLHTAGGAIQENITLPEHFKRKPCVYPWERIILNSKGQLGFCPTDWTGESEIIDYRKTTIKELWDSEYYRSLRQMHLDDNFSACHICKKCKDWVNTSWPQEKNSRGYGDLISDFRKKTGSKVEIDEQ